MGQPRTLPMPVGDPVREQGGVGALVSLLHGWHLTSLDGPTVAVIWTLAFAWAARVRLPVWAPLGLGLAAWFAYIGDRLLDAYRRSDGLRARHHFHWRHRRVFLPVALLAAAGAVGIALSVMPLAARERGSMLAAAALVYFASVHSPRRRPIRLPKELLVGVLFTLACAIPTWARVAGRRGELAIPLVSFIALAWLNCHAIESWESGQEPGWLTIRRMGWMVAVLAGICAAIVWRTSASLAALLVAALVSAVFLICLDHGRERLSPVTLRAAADLALLTPLALLAWT